MSLQVLVLLLTSPLPPGGTGPTCQIETPAGQRATGRHTEGQPTGQPDRAQQQHRQQLQQERQSHMRLGTATHSPFSSRNTETNQKPRRAGVWRVCLPDKEPNIGRSENPNRQTTQINFLSKLPVARMTAITVSDMDKRPGCNNGHGVNL